MKKILFIIMFFGITACQGNLHNTEYSIIDKKLEELHSVDSHKKFLEEVFNNDQKYRQINIETLVLRYGKYSKEVQEFINKNNAQDVENFNTIEKYLLIYGFPKIEEVGEIAAQTPWAVIHHSNKYEEKERNFHYLYNAFLDENIDESAFSMYLERMYRIKYAKRFSANDNYKSQDKIDTLISLLNLHKYKSHNPM